VSIAAGTYANETANQQVNVPLTLEYVSYPALMPPSNPDPFTFNAFGRSAGWTRRESPSRSLSLPASGGSS
jgi:hypothetical protein